MLSTWECEDTEIFKTYLEVIQNMKHTNFINFKHLAVALRVLNMVYF